MPYQGRVIKTLDNGEHLISRLKRLGQAETAPNSKKFIFFY